MLGYMRTYRGLFNDKCTYIIYACRGIYRHNAKEHGNYQLSYPVPV